ncbi:MAG: hypothetical protein PHC44_05770 [Lutispora sp.]|nr:hypothetical protein [Lutispora sp.]MDD4834223.1 hypothetical protein [Lutispora sp.]
MKKLLLILVCLLLLIGCSQEKQTGVLKAGETEKQGETILEKI